MADQGDKQPPTPLAATSSGVVALPAASDQPTPQTTAAISPSSKTTGATTRGRTKKAATKLTRAKASPPRNSPTAAASPTANITPPATTSPTATTAPATDLSIATIDPPATSEPAPSADSSKTITESRRGEQNADEEEVEFLHEEQGMETTRPKRKSARLSAQIRTAPVTMKRKFELKLAPQPKRANPTSHDTVRQRKVSPPKVVDETSLRKLNLHVQVRKLLRNIGWECLYYLPEYYIPVHVHEFFDTYTLTYSLDNAVAHEDRLIKFNIGGRHFHLNLIEFNHALGLISNTEDDSEMTSYEEYLCHGSPPKDWDPKEAFRELTGDVRAVWSTKSSTDLMLHDHALRYVHRILVFLLTTKVNQSFLLGTNELYILWCMRKGVKLNLGVWLSCRFRDIGVSSNALVGTPFVSKIAEFYDMCDPDTTTLPKQSAPLLDLSTLERMKLIEKQGSKWEWVKPIPEHDRGKKAGPSGVEKDDGQESRMKSLEANLMQLRRENMQLRKEVRRHQSRTEHYLRLLLEERGIEIPPDSDSE